jgi:hypothetical protein
MPFLREIMPPLRNQLQKSSIMDETHSTVTSSVTEASE